MKFNIEDNVLVNKSFLKNKKGKIIGKWGRWYCVEFDEVVRGAHDGYGEKDSYTNKPIRGKYGHCWYMEESWFTLTKKRNLNKRI